MEWDGVETKCRIKEGLCMIDDGCVSWGGLIKGGAYKQNPQKSLGPGI